MGIVLIARDKHIGIRFIKRCLIMVLSSVVVFSMKRISNSIDVTVTKIKEMNGNRKQKMISIFFKSRKIRDIIALMIIKAEATRILARLFPRIIVSNFIGIVPSIFKLSFSRLIDDMADVENVTSVARIGGK